MVVYTHWKGHPVAGRRVCSGGPQGADRTETGGEMLVEGLPLSQGNGQPCRQCVPALEATSRRRKSPGTGALGSL